MVRLVLERLPFDYGVPSVWTETVGSNPVGRGFPSGLLCSRKASDWGSVVTGAPETCSTWDTDGRPVRTPPNLCSLSDGPEGRRRLSADESTPSRW